VIEKWMEKWHQQVRGELAGGLDSLLADDVVFYSPIVFTPQRGKELTKLYLRAAGNTLGGGDSPAGEGAPNEGSFRYVTEIMAGNTALLEFESEMNGKYVNGIDLITCNTEGRIVEFKVMIRPLQAINEVHAHMKAMLEKLSS
jgi:hypothetical protein